MDDYLSLLPHVPPMRLLEEVLELVPGERCTASRVTRPDDFFFQGHFPGNPVVPACILLELLAQTGGLAAGSDERFAHARTTPCGCGRSVQVSVGRPFRCAARGISPRRRTAWSAFKVDGTVTADGVLVASGGVTLARVGE